MTMPMIKKLIAKDLYLCRLLILKYFAVSAALAGATYLIVGRGMTIVALQVMLATYGFHVILATVLGERTQKTKSFTLNLPITAREYTVAKIAANLLMFAPPWAIFTLSISAFIYVSPEWPTEMISYLIAIFLELLLAFCAVLAVALIWESLSGMLCTVAACLIVYSSSFVVFEVMPNTVSILAISAEAVLLPFLIYATLYLQGRKKDLV